MPWVFGLTAAVPLLWDVTPLDCGYVAYDNSYNSMIGVFLLNGVYLLFFFGIFVVFYLFYFVPKTKKGASNTFHTSDRHLPPSTYFFVVSNNNWVFVSCNNNWVPCCDCLLSSTVVKNKKKYFFQVLGYGFWSFKIQLEYPFVDAPLSSTHTQQTKFKNTIQHQTPPKPPHKTSHPNFHY